MKRGWLLGVFLAGLLVGGVTLHSARSAGEEVQAPPWAVLGFNTITPPLPQLFRGRPLRLEVQKSYVGDHDQNGVLTPSDTVALSGLAFDGEKEIGHWVLQGTNFDPTTSAVAGTLYVITPTGDLHVGLVNRQQWVRPVYAGTGRFAGLQKVLVFGDLKNVYVATR